MPETQIKIEIQAFFDLFPLFCKFQVRKSRGVLKTIKRQKQFFILTVELEKKDEIFILCEDFYIFKNLFNVQKVIFDYK